MTELFLLLLNMSFSASWIVLAVLLLRVLLKRMPRWVNCLLWGIVALRLVIPCTMESVFSLVPSPEVIPQDIAVSQTPAIHSGIPAINKAVNPFMALHFTEDGPALGQILTIAAAVWAAGAAAMLIYSVVSYGRLRRQVGASLLIGENIYLCDDVDSPFILGVIRPRIYIPSGISEAQLRHVLDHENAHLKRWDHLWKPFGFSLLAIYWFNPLLWLAYVLLCRDIEQACDEKVIARMDDAGKKAYSSALLACSAHRRMIMACPVAFGEVGVKGRILSVLNYKKPSFWIVTVSLVACGLVAVCFLTNPIPCKHVYDREITMGATCTQRGVEDHTCTLCQYSYAVPIGRIAHTYDAGAVTEEPTCTRKGSMERTCSVCGAVKKEKVEKTAHTYDEGRVVQEPSCVRRGSWECTCIDCGAKKVEAMEKTAHIAGVPTFVKEPNCTEKGAEYATCSVCNAVYVVGVLETNEVHDLFETVLQEATCTVPGEVLYSCTRCSYSEKGTFAQIEHSYETVSTIQGNCTIPTKKKMVCTDCNDTYWMKLSTTNDHVWIELRHGYQCLWCYTIVSREELEALS